MAFLYKEDVLAKALEMLERASTQPAMQNLEASKFYECLAFYNAGIIDLANALTKSDEKKES